MGQGGYINVINATPYKWIRKKVRSYQMNSWDRSFPESLDPGAQKKCYIEFDQSIFKKSTDDAGEVIYSIENTSCSFEIQARGNPKFRLQVDWNSATDLSGIYMFPPIEVKNNKTNLGWFHDGTLTFVIGHNAIAHPIDYVQADSYPKNWMQLYAPVIKHMSVRDLTLPGTHDSGSYDVVSDLAKPWTQTQNIDIYHQLCTGVRSLDLRVGYQSGASGDQSFILVHDIWRTKVTLKNALEQIIKFSDEYPQEIIVLDFHRFVNLSSGDFDHSKLHKIINTTLGERMIPPSYQDRSLHSIWASNQQRIIVAYNNHNSSSSFWGGVDQKWSSRVKNVNDLDQFITDTFSNSLPSGLWSMQTATSNGFYHPVNISHNLNSWFKGGSKKSKLANIIAVDWIEKTNLVNDAICASFLKGVKEKV